MVWLVLLYVSLFLFDCINWRIFGHVHVFSGHPFFMTVHVDECMSLSYIYLVIVDISNVL